LILKDPDMVNTRTIHIFLALVLAAGVSACSQQDGEAVDATEAIETTEEQAVSESGNTENESFEIAPGLTARTLKNGYGRAAEAGDMVDVHYTGWLYDESAADSRGTKFDSSVDRGELFSFPLGAGRVIKGWDQGVVGMLIGEKRELTIAPDMAYGDRGAGNVIPPGATLVFEVELFSLMGPGDTE
jgi:FKBP-type peptidyl-prolyl cis-trans isomerase FkpA